MDQLVLAVQRWLNATYEDHSQFNTVTEDGVTGNETINALTRALQIELGITNLSDNFGEGTAGAFTPLSQERFGTEESHNLVYILQGGFWCKGYSPGTFDGIFNDQTVSAVESFQSDVGLNETGVVDAKLMEALLNTDGFRLVGSVNVRSVQQILNAEYARGYFDYVPTNGIYERQTNQGIIYGLQIEQGIGDIANGNYGPSTIENTPTLVPGNNQTGLNRILQFGLAVNGYFIPSFNGIYDSFIENRVREFQEFMTLPVTGIADMPTIKQLLTSNGYIHRNAIACDASMVINDQTAQTLVDNGYEVIGRYLTGTVVGGRSKAMTHNELSILTDHDIRVFPIYQDGGHYNDYFSSSQGQQDAEIAVNTAFELGFPEGSTIYFAVDYDAYDYQVTNNIIPYVRAIKNFFDRLENDASIPTYQVGVYGPRNVCIRCQNELNVVYSFVANMSTGFSGNLGYPMPENWAFGQFYETSIGSGSGYLEIDKNDYSGKDTGATQFNPQEPADRTPEEEEVFDEWRQLVENTPVLSDYYFLLSPQFEFGQTYVLAETSYHRIEASASVDYTFEGEIEGLAFNVTNGEIEGSIEENLGEDSSILTSFGLSTIEQGLESVAVGVDNGTIGVNLEVQGNELHCHLNLYKEEIETETDTLTLTSRVTVVLSLDIPDFSQEQVEYLTYISAFALGTVALFVIFSITSTTTAVGAIGLFIAAFIGFPSNQ